MLASHWPLDTGESVWLGESPDVVVSSPRAPSSSDGFDETPLAQLAAAVMTAPAARNAPTEKATARNLRASMGKPHPDLPYDSLMNVLFAEAAASFERLTLDDQDDSLTWQEPGAWPNTFRKARFLSAIDHIQLDRLRRLVMQDMDATFQGVDAIIGPCLAGPMLIITNFTGHPCLALRSGFRKSPTRQRLSLAKARLDQGAEGEGEQFLVPHAISLYGRLFDEGVLIRIGAALEARLGVAGARPPLDR